MTTGSSSCRLCGAKTSTGQPHDPGCPNDTTVE